MINAEIIHVTMLTVKGRIDASALSVHQLIS